MLNYFLEEHLLMSIPQENKLVSVFQEFTILFNTQDIHSQTQSKRWMVGDSNVKKIPQDVTILLALTSI